MSEKVKKIIYIILSIFVICFLLFVIVDHYNHSKITDDDLVYVTDEFIDYSKTKHHYNIECINDEYIITQINASDEMIESIVKGDTLEIGLYGNEIIVLKINGSEILSLTDSNNNYKRQVTISLIVIPSVILLIALMVLFLNLKFKKYQKQIIAEQAKYEQYPINEEIYEKIQSSIYKENGKYICNILEYIESDELIKTFCKAIMDYIDEDRIIIMYDQAGKNNSLILLFYKLNNKLCFEELFEENGLFEIDKDLYWYYPFDASETKEECESFVSALEEFILFNKDIFKIM